MKATFDGQDYLLTLNRETQDLQELQKKGLEAQLTEQWGTEKLGKLVTLELADNNGSDGIELKYTPCDAESWEAIQGIQVKINNQAYNYIKERGQFGTRYNGSDKIEIICN